MRAAVLRAIGTVPRYEEFPEPVIGNKDGEVIVHVQAASLKPVDKQLADHNLIPRRGVSALVGDTKGLLFI